ncbi:MFS transporter [Herbiconiux moechotypicola]|uniref:MFS transporter n=1 Tax=Herbiconiux moechotypicola TaxID=637393 RepID=A0ABN3DUN9_9MICO|nr:MFS transporter [Herbiconiux moechotypicola]MCS5730595.1 MFS transporter [Herbiconiux moechotypicola]
MTVRRGVVPLIAVCCGVTVANIYLAHPILSLLAQSFGVADADTAFIVTVAQISYACGLFLLVPLGDVVRRKRLLAVLLAGTGVGLALAALAGGLGMLAAATVLIGAFTVAPHVLIPYAVSVVEPGRQGRALAAINAGMTGGIVLSRVFGGALGEYLGWHSVYLCALVLTAGVGLATVLVLPKEPRREGPSYPRLIGSTLRLLVDEPGVRWAVGVQVPVFATFNVIWVMIVFLLTDRYGMSVAAAGLFGLFSLVTMATAPFVGRFLDRRGSTMVMGVFLGVLVAGAVLFQFSELAIGFVVAGIMLLNLGQQGAGIANQSRILNLRADSRSRLNTLYMTSNFVGGSLASLVAVAVFATAGWSGVVLTALVLSLVAFGVWLADALRRRRLGRRRLSRPDAPLGPPRRTRAANAR